MLLGGPYEPPQFEVGSTVHDEALGDVVVVGTEKKTGWPLCDEPTRPGPNPYGKIPILTGDLVRAVCEESIDAVAEHWKVKPRLVRRWREAIAGTTEDVNTALALLRHNPNFRKKWY
jgi:hypothetical protein